MPGNPAFTDDSRVRAVLDSWRKKLLDLTKRNRALNFRRNPVSTVCVVDELPAEVFRVLYLEERAMRFEAAPEDGTGRGDQAAAAAVRDEASQASPLDELGEAPPSDAPAFVPYHRAGVAARHADDELQTDAPSKKLDKSLLRLYDTARTSLEEQGVNTLFLSLGMLVYTEADDSTVQLSAPLVLVPVQIERKSARSAFSIEASGDDAIVNPALAELLQRVHGIRLPTLPAPAEMPDDYDLQTLLHEVQQLVASRAGWSVNNSIYLAPLSFQKFVMFKDLEARASLVTGHPLIRRMVLRTGEQFVELPDDIRGLDLDSEFPPEKTFQVVDADSSQLRALATVARGHDCVIEGPPGTGKSQTITNLIAQALAADKSVLFVAEKKAALDVVHSRLQAAGLDEFCLELHSSKINRRRVLEGVASALNASIQRSSGPTDAGQRLPESRLGLSDYVRAVHGPAGKLGFSPYRAYGELSTVANAPKVRLDAPIDGIDPVELGKTIRDLDELAVVADAVGVPAQHPWRDSRRTFLSASDTDGIREAAEDAVRHLEDVIARSRAVASAFDLPIAQTPADVLTQVGIAGVMKRSPGAPTAVLSSERWNAPPAEASELIESGRKTAAFRSKLLEKLLPEALDEDPSSDVAFIEVKCSGFFSFLAFTNGRYRLIKKRWRAWRAATYAPSVLEQAATMRRVIAYREASTTLASARDPARELFGDAWHGEQSDWKALEDYTAWVVEFRALCLKHTLSQRVIEAASRPAPDTHLVADLKAVAESLGPKLDKLVQMVEWPGGYLDGLTFEETLARLRELLDGLSSGSRWVAFEARRSRVAGGPAREVLAPAMAGELRFDQLGRAFLRAFLQRWIDAIVKEREPLRLFNGLTHEQRIAEFRRLDRRVLEENRAALIARLRERTQTRLRDPSAVAAMPLLRKEMAKQRRHNPIRQTLKRSEAAVRAIKPCFLMSPLTVAQYLDESQTGFDLVIFDEASQLPPEDAVGAISRATRLVVVGDPKQLPPTNFFSVMGGQTTAVLDENGEPAFQDSESILEEMMATGVPKTSLKWHYRSAHESLITFSNVSFYGSELYTFPSVDLNSHSSGLQFEYIPDGVYEGNGMNLVEARRVADAVIDHARKRPNESLGVGTFNLRQQIAIQDEIEQRRRADPSVDSFFTLREQDGFFVKNLENIQGDERDVIFLSVTYGKSPDGRLYYRFGPLNMDNGWRRMNVLTTRARKRMRVFSSLRCDDIAVHQTQSQGARLLRAFLMFAERGTLDSTTVSAQARMESPFEKEVHAELTRRGLTLHPQVGAAGYRIDFGVRDDEIPGRFICGLECDGAAYHSCETARDRDRLRQQVLELRGWIIHRVWSTDWFFDRPRQVERILKLVAESKVQVRAEIEARIEAEKAAALALPPLAAAASIEPEQAEPITRVYVRPEAPEYAFAQRTVGIVYGQLLDAPRSEVKHAIDTVIQLEAPIHVNELASRVAGMWGQNAGSRILQRIMDLLYESATRGAAEVRGEFVYLPARPIAVRSRAATGLNAGKIAPEEYREAVLTIARQGFGFDRPALVAEVRALLGFNRSGAQLASAIGSAIDALLGDGTLGEDSSGIALRK